MPLIRKSACGFSIVGCLFRNVVVSLWPIFGLKFPFWSFLRHQSLLLPIQSSFLSPVNVADRVIHKRIVVEAL